MSKKAMVYSDKPTSSAVFKQVFAAPEVKNEDVYEESHRRRTEIDHLHGIS